jgi:predicted metalloprotease
MRLGSERSANVEDRRGMGMPIVGGGIGTLVLALVVYLLGGDPGVVINNAPAPEQQGRAVPTQPGQADAGADFVSAVLADTEQSWNTLFAQQLKKDYPEPKLVLFSGAVQSGCGMAQSAMGPFYCPLDQKVYIDLQFYADMKERFGAPGDFAQAYVIAHEVGHHVQNVLGISDQVRDAQQRGGQAQANALSVRLELQADCLAGVWGHHAQATRKILEPGDIEEALGAASAIGDDRLQRQTQGRVVPESFTHGSSEQRMRWFKTGFEGGDMERCDTFRAQTL